MGSGCPRRRGGQHLSLGRDPAADHPGQHRQCLCRHHPGRQLSAWQQRAGSVRLLRQCLGMVLRQLGRDLAENHRPGRGRSALAGTQRPAGHPRRQLRFAGSCRPYQLPPSAGKGRHACRCRLPHRVRSWLMANPATPLGDPDATIVVGAADADATLVVGAPASRPVSPPSSTAASSMPAAGNAARVEFLRKVQARAQAQAQLKAKAADPTLAATVTTTEPPVPGQPRDDSKRKKAFFSPVITRVVARGLLSQRDAISASLRARDQGTTFLGAIAQINTLAGDVEFYKGLAEEAGLAFIANDRELVQILGEAEWLTYKEADQRGCLLLKPDDQGGARYAAIDPFDVITRDWISDRLAQPATPVVVLPAAFQTVLGSLKTRIEPPKTGDESLVPIDVSWQQETKILNEPSASDVPLVVDYILQRCHGQGASDVHLEPTEEGMVVRARLDGILHEQSRMPLAPHSAVVSRIKVLGGMDVAERRRPQDGRIRVMIRRSPLDIRVSTLPTVLGEKVVMRLLDDSAVRPSPEQLGLRDRHL